MTDLSKKIEHAKWLLERTLGWITTADVKVGVVIAMDTAMFGGLAAAYSASDSGTRGSWAYLTLSLACLGLVLSAFCASMAAIPRLLGPASSLIFFARISEKPSHQFNEDFLRLDDSAFLNDLTTQIHRNAEIAAAKHAWVRRSLICSFIAAIPWVSAIAILVKM